MSKASRIKKTAPRDMLELFFPIHYTVGMTVEDTLRNEVLTRQQTIILWLIRARGEGGVTMRRKDIAASMTYWFDLTNSAISKALRSLARPPLSLLDVSEDPNSGREKVVTLTAKGETFLQEMMRNAEGLIKIITDEMTDEEIVQGLHFFTRISEIFDAEVEQKRALPGATVPRPSVKRRS
jgi:DNA-binding MarR family transcriptional regulator